MTKGADSNSLVIQRRLVASTHAPKRGVAGMPGTVAGLLWNGWPESAGISGRIGLENAFGGAISCRMASNRALMLPP